MKVYHQVFRLFRLPHYIFHTSGLSFFFFSCVATQPIPYPAPTSSSPSYLAKLTWTHATSTSNPFVCALFFYGCSDLKVGISVYHPYHMPIVVGTEWTVYPGYDKGSAISILGFHLTIMRTVYPRWSVFGGFQAYPLLRVEGGHTLWGIHSGFWYDFNKWKGGLSIQWTSTHVHYTTQETMARGNTLILANHIMIGTRSFVSIGANAVYADLRGAHAWVFRHWYPQFSLSIGRFFPNPKKGNSS